MWGFFHKPWNKDPYIKQAVSWKVTIGLADLSKAIFFVGLGVVSATLFALYIIACVQVGKTRQEPRA